MTAKNDIRVDGDVKMSRLTGCQGVMSRGVNRMEVDTGYVGNEHEQRVSS